MPWKGPKFEGFNFCRESKMNCASNLTEGSHFENTGAVVEFYIKRKTIFELKSLVIKIDHHFSGDEVDFKMMNAYYISSKGMRLPQEVFLKSCRLLKNA